MNQYSGSHANEQCCFKHRTSKLAVAELNVQSMLSGSVLHTEDYGTNGVFPLFNVKTLETLSGGDKIFTAKLIDLFISTTPPLLLQLEHAAAFEHWNDVFSIAHKLKSTIDTMGIDAASDIIREIEHHARFTDETSLIPAKAGRFIVLINQTIDEMKHWLLR